jgi:hypothetical protein
MAETTDFSTYPKERGPDRREHPEPNGQRLKITGPQLAQLAVWLVTIMLAYGALSERITRLEVKYDRLVADISEVKGDVKLLLRIVTERPQQP